MTSPTVIAVLAKNSRESVRIALDEFRGLHLIDVRVLAKVNDPKRRTSPHQERRQPQGRAAARADSGA
jgi:hypothetical protein